MNQLSLYEGQRLQMDESIELTSQSLNAYGSRYEHWAVMWSGGKDSTALLTLLIHLIESGRVARPKRLTVFYADTRMEILPLWIAASEIRDELTERGIDVHVLMAPVDERFFVYMLGRGVPPPNGMRMRWCTDKLKVQPARRALEGAFVASHLGYWMLGKERHQKILILTGVRQGESAVRDGRIEMSCGKDGAECGQGWYQLAMPEAISDSLAPLLHMRVCHVWEWLRYFAPQEQFGGWSTEPLAQAYGGDEAEEKNNRTGCVSCALVEKDKALMTVCHMPAWSYLSPLIKLRAFYESLRSPAVRLRKRGFERRQDGTLRICQQPLGPLTLETRLRGLEFVLSVQDEVNTNAIRQGRPTVDILNTEEETRIRELIATETWPNGWSGDEPLGSELIDLVFNDGAVQPTLWRDLP